MMQQCVPITLHDVQLVNGSLSHGTERKINNEKQ